MQNQLKVILLLFFSYPFLLLPIFSKVAYDTQVRHQIIPFPYHVEGVGKVIGVTYIGRNLLLDSSDLVIGQTVIDETISFAMLDNFEISLFHSKLRFALFSGQNITMLNSYSRGMERTTPYNTEFNADGYFVDISSLLLDEIFYLNLGYLSISEKINNFKNESGEIIAKPNASLRNIDTGIFFGSLHLNLIDSVDFPHAGLKIGYDFHELDPEQVYSSSSINTYFLDYYIPINKYFTIAGQTLRSEAYIAEAKNRDISELLEKNGLNCGDMIEVEEISQCEEFETRYLKHISDYNKNGISVPLGGPNKIRSDFLFRYQGSTTQYNVVEFRYAEFQRELDYFIEAALIFENGRTYDKESDENQNSDLLFTRGIGLRLYDDFVSYRIDFVWDQNDSYGLSMVFGKPW